MKSEFRGNAFEYVFLKIFICILSTVTFGLAYPWLVCAFLRWETENSVIDGRRLAFVGRGAQLFLLQIKWTVLTLITIGIYGFFIPIAYRRWRVENTRLYDEVKSEKKKA